MCSMHSEQFGDFVFGCFVVLLVCGMIVFEVIILPRSLSFSLALGWPAWYWSIFFAVATFVWILIASVLWKGQKRRLQTRCDKSPTATDRNKTTKPADV